MNILYISDHAILEYNEVSLFTRLGHDVFSLGAYHNLGHDDLPRPKVKGLKYHKGLDEVYVKNPNRNEIAPEIIAWADVIIFMHAPDVMVENWERIKHKRVIWRSIGQSVKRIEEKLRPLKSEGLEIVRYSPKERNIEGYIGEDAIIRFDVDPDVFTGWNGEDRKAVAFSQSLKGRREFCHYNEIMHVIEAVDGRVYGPGNEDLGKFNGGNLSFDHQLKKMRRAGVLVYGGTWPASYTLSFIEALMMGLPIVAGSKAIAHVEKFEGIDFYEVDEILAEIGGAVCDTKEQMVLHTRKLLTNRKYAEDLSIKQRELALKYFDTNKIGKQWQELLK